MGSESTIGAGEVPGERGRRENERSGIGRLLFDLRFRRHRFRQFLGAALIFLLTFQGLPERNPLWIGSILACLGMAVRMWASGVVMKNEVLATSGPYGHVRHPLYVGNFLICVGFCFASGLWWSVPLSIVFWWAYYPTTIRHEDQKLRNRFPDQWDRWAAQTRPLLPRLTSYEEGRGSTSWSPRRSLMRNGEPLHVIVLGGCLVYLFLELGA